jgi:hypothetical protein
MLDPDALIEGMIEIKTESGQSVIVIEKGRYEIAETGEVLTSDNPKALSIDGRQKI